MDLIEGVVSTEALKEYFEGLEPTDPIFREVVLLDDFPMNRAYIEDGFIILGHYENIKGVYTKGETLYRYLSYVLNATGDANRNFPIFIDTPKGTHDRPLLGVSRTYEALTLTTGSTK